MVRFDGVLRARGLFRSLLLFSFFILVPYEVLGSCLSAGGAAVNAGLSNTLLSGAVFSPVPLTIIIILLAISTGLTWLIIRLNRSNRTLAQKTSDLGKQNEELSKLNEELSAQKDRIQLDHLKTDRFFLQLIEAADDGISFYDNNWNLEYANSAFYSIIGYDRESYLKTDPEEILHPDDHSYPATRKIMLEKQGIYEAGIRLKHSDGHFINLSTRSAVIHDDKGASLGALTISRDVSNLHKVNEDLLRANREAENSNKLKSSFLANISHEIRTPLNSVVGFSNLLLSDDITKETRAEYIDQINYNSEKLLQIIGDIIDLSRLESSQIEISYEEASVNEIVNEVVEEARQAIRRNEKPVLLTLKPGADESIDLVFTDRIWLKRVLSHLMDNAVKFTLEGSIELSYQRKEGNLIFSIRDTGIGISQQNLGRIFEQFNQEINGHHRPFEGLGIGLTLAREVLGRMGGTITVESEKGVGSEFTFTIPYRPAGSTRSKLRSLIQESAPVITDWSRYKCLLVDDNKDVLIYLKRILLDTGIDILLSRSGVEAVDLISKTPDIDLVLLDMQMPEMNGIEATREIRKIRRNLPIIAQTAFIFDDDKDIIIEAGCDACLVKPIRKEQLLTVMSTFLKQ